MAKIVESLKKFGYIDESEEKKEAPLPEKGSVEDVFYSEDGILPNSQGGLGLDLKEEVKFPWEREKSLREKQEVPFLFSYSVARLYCTRNEHLQ